MVDGHFTDCECKNSWHGIVVNWEDEGVYTLNPANGNCIMPSVDRDKCCKENGDIFDSDIPKLHFAMKGKNYVHIYDGLEIVKEHTKW